MISTTSRSRLYELRRDFASATRGADLLERKRDVLLRETTSREARLAQLRAAVEIRYAEAKHLLRIAEVGLGHDAVAAAALAQPATCAMERHEITVMGVRLQELRCSSPPFRAIYGAAPTSAALDSAAAAFTALLPLVVELAAARAALDRLRVAVRKATKIVNALQKVILPRIGRQIRLTVDSIAEEERDEAVRRKVRMAS